MQAVRYHEHGGRDVLTVEEIERPTPEEDELLIEVQAASVNPVDTYFREGSYEPGTLPWIPGSDAAGVVAAVGSDVEEFRVGDRVFATGLGRAHQGTCAEYVLAPTQMVARLPSGISPEMGAAVGLVGTTAWQALIATCGLEPAETCLIHGGSGGVGHVAVQLASAAGADVTTTASTGYHERLRGLGADETLDYRRDDLAEAVENAGNPDVILDHRLDEYLSFDATVAAQGGRIAAIGNESPAATFEDVPRCRAKALSVHHVSVFNTPTISTVLDRLADLVADGDLDPVIARTYSLDGVEEAHRAVREDSYLGKLVVVP